MYRLINENIQAILNSIQKKHVAKYVWLMKQRNDVENKHYQKEYCDFWIMKAPSVTAEQWFQAYFLKLSTDLRFHNTPDIAGLVKDLYETPTQKNGKKSLQFSFASKFCHMVNPYLPVYDSKVAAFYFFKEPPKKKNETQEELEARISKLMEFYRFLQIEYQRIQEQSLLADAIEAFRLQFRSVDNFTNDSFTNAKVIDSLIWAFVKWLNTGVVIQQQLMYRK